MKGIFIKLLLIILVISILSTSINIYAGNLGNNITINEGNNISLFTCYSSVSGWIDLQTPELTVAGTNQVAYCLDHRLGNPSGTSNPFNPNALYDTKTYKGIVAILEWGYPYNNGGLSARRARYATQNAIRTWLAESAGIGYINMMKPENVKPKTGEESTYDFYLFLLEKARLGVGQSRSITANPSTVKLTLQNNVISGTVKVTLNNLNSKYTIDNSKLPANVNISGYTGNDGDILTITIPKSLAGQTINLSNILIGNDTRSPANIYWYEPTTNTQKTVIVDEEIKTMAYGSITIQSDELTGNLSLIKTSEDDTVSGFQFRITGNGLDKTVITDSQGKVTVNDLKEGTYTITEINVPDRYVTPKTQQVTIKADETTTFTFSNTVKKGYVELLKSDENNNMLIGAVFGIYESIDDKKIGELVTGSDGIAKSDLLNYGNYYLQEITAPDGYVISDMKYEFSIKNDNEIIKIIASNKVQKAKITITKIDSETGSISQGSASLYGAVFEILDSSKNLVETLSCSSNSNTVTSSDLMLGKYYIKEVIPPQGYTLNTDLIEIDLLYSDQYTEINYESFEVANKVIKGTVKIHKNDYDTSEPLEGILFTLYDIEGNELQSVYTNSEGIAEISDIVYGEYYIKEESALPGYILNETLYNFEINNDGEVIEIETESGKGFQNKAQKGSLKINKSSSDNVLEGFTFLVQGTSQTGHIYNKTFITDSNGEIYIDDLRIGTYTVSEIEGKNTERYVLPDSQTIVIKYNEATEIKFFNIEKIPDIPETGDRNKHIYLFAFALTLSSITLFIINTKRIRRKKYDK